MNYSSRRDNTANVSELQGYLRYIAQNTRGIPLVNVDGVYGKKTAAATAEIQRRSGLVQTGRADLETWNAVIGIYGSIERKKREPLPVFAYPLEIPYMSEGDAYDEVYILQVMLRRMGRIFENIPEVKVTGIFDFVTRDAVNSFKDCCAISEEDGKVDRETWNALAEVYRAFTYND